MFFTEEGVLRQSETNRQLLAETPKGVPPIIDRMTTSSSGDFRLVTPARFETTVAGSGMGISVPVRIPVPRSAPANIQTSPHSSSTPMRMTPLPERGYRAHQSDGVKTPTNLGIGRITPSSAKPFKCPQTGCGRCFATKGGCNRHYGQVHKRRVMSEEREIESEDELEYVQLEFGKDTDANEDLPMESGGGSDS